MKKKIYLDNAAGSPIDPRVIKAMIDASKHVGNPASFNGAGRDARDVVAKARKTIANFVNARPEEIVFTGSGSEANNLAIFGVAKAFQARIRNPQSAINKFSKPHIIVSQIEHPSVLEPVGELESYGFQVTYLSVDSGGFVDLNKLRKAIRPETILISIMYANNEIGAIQEIAKISKTLKLLNLETHGKVNSLFHVDACQAAGYLNMNIQHLGADLLTFNGSKIYGPRGIGVLYVRRGTPIKAIVAGGSQEHGLRAGTENTAAIAGLAKAISLIKLTDGKKISKLRDYTIAMLEKNIPNVRLNGPVGEGRLANNVNVSVPGLTSEALLLELDKYGISAGSGSACTAHSVEPSHVLKAIGVPKKCIHGALRLTLSKHTTKIEIYYLVGTLKKIIPVLQKRYRVA